MPFPQRGADSTADLGFTAHEHAQDTTPPDAPWWPGLHNVTCITPARTVRVFLCAKFSLSRVSRHIHALFEIALQFIINSSSLYTKEPAALQGLSLQPHVPIPSQSELLLDSQPNLLDCSQKLFFPLSQHRQFHPEPRPG